MANYVGEQDLQSPSTNTRDAPASCSGTVAAAWSAFPTRWRRRPHRADGSAPVAGPATWRSASRGLSGADRRSFDEFEILDATQAERAENSARVTQQLGSVVGSFRKLSDEMQTDPGGVKLQS
jgi:hypothetical protein